MKQNRLYYIWGNMKNRCHNPRNKRYKDYGGRGIRVCMEWYDSFFVFRNWAYSTGYADDLEIDRIDNDKGYYPANCRWVTIAQQATNRRPQKRRPRRNPTMAEGFTKLVDKWKAE